MVRPFRFSVIALISALALASCSSGEGQIESVIDADSPDTTEVADPDDTTPTTAGEDDVAASTMLTTTTVEPPDTTEADAPTTTGSADAPTTTVEAPVGDDICVPLKVVSDFDVAASELTDTASWPELQAFFIETTPLVLEAYDDAIALDTDLTDELEALKTITADTTALAADSASLEELGGSLLAMPGILEAGDDALTLDTFAEENCGFSTGGN